MAPIGFPETSATNHGYKLRNIPEERKSLSIAISAVITVVLINRQCMFFTWVKQIQGLLLARTFAFWLWEWSRNTVVAHQHSASVGSRTRSKNSSFLWRHTKLSQLHPPALHIGSTSFHALFLAWLPKAKINRLGMIFDYEYCRNLWACKDGKLRCVTVRCPKSDERQSGSAA